MKKLLIPLALLPAAVRAAAQPIVDVHLYAVRFPFSVLRVRSRGCRRSRARNPGAASLRRSLGADLRQSPAAGLRPVLVRDGGSGHADRHDAGDRRVSPPPQREARFTFGAESRNEYLVDGQKIVRDSRATLSRGTLLISTDTTPPDGQRWLSNILRWSLDADGTLVVGDTEICGKGECPSVVTTLKFKRQ